MSTKIGVVGDLSGGSPERLARVLDAALVACDIIVQVGDLEPAYEQVRSRVLTSGHKLFPLPGNHDTEYDKLNIPRRWKTITPDGLATLIGIDNSNMHITGEDRDLFNNVPTGHFLFVFGHMAPWPIVLPDGTKNMHTMLESGPNQDADWLTFQLRQYESCFCAGHYHGSTLQKTPWGDMVVEGRGGAAPDLAYTLITVTPEGWVYHSIPA